MTQYSRVLWNPRICIFYPKICMFFIKTDRFCFTFDLTQKCKFLTDHRHGSRKSKVLNCNINTPLILRFYCWGIFIFDILSIHSIACSWRDRIEKRILWFFSLCCLFLIPWCMQLTCLLPSKWKVFRQRNTQTKQS